MALAHELARRLGRDRCYVVQWPSDDGGSLAAARRRQQQQQQGGAGAAAQDQQQQQGQQGPQAGQQAGEEPGLVGGDAEGRSEWFRKDANEVLLKDGAQDLLQYVAAAQVGGLGGGVGPFLEGSSGRGRGRQGALAAAGGAVTR
jgi:hypothetical protein